MDSIEYRIEPGDAGTGMPVKITAWQKGDKAGRPLALCQDAMIAEYLKAALESGASAPCVRHSLALYQVLTEIKVGDEAVQCLSDLLGLCRVGG